ncbi:peptidase C45 acyl-coenzyme A:6-aminopenicillanic acid acyl-transferase [Natranaerobius thermophilus JW/NM-WN-LF]|uniref:Peptidase C45 acyl-coenzyme A:6-aminopenicillanic acid acyl-transferase n=1 Tax=Natranaerobius thermophilus (strain ATCC BAA-1301 / DSM 18059 / JW/NM-WN-LF) TaxID=457570 RepID=B2A296_NATTJ|nr:peptidase C45 acyl-coenzyme A:6-aminopenicillanic acid acyl-transferase [Natranaerobius thermophilus JW/NM-WN-LF]
MKLSTNNKGLSIYKYTGSHEEIGYAYGKAESEAIHHYINFLYEIFEKGGTTREVSLQHARKYIPYIENYSPSIAMEMKSIAKGAGCKYEEIVMIHLHEERQSFMTDGCTAFAATSNVTRDKEVLSGQTWDISYSLCKNAQSIILNLNRENEPEVICYTYAGMISGAGINSHGITLNWNSVPRLELQVGVPTYIIIAEVLRQETIGQAIKAVLDADRAGCFNFVITDETEIYNIEATPEDVDVQSSEKMVYHANHFVSDKFAESQDLNHAGSRYNGSSIVRHNRMKRLLKESWGKITVPSCQEILSDHINYPDSICRHPLSRDDDLEPIVTCASWVMAPSQRKMWVSNGPACENGFVEYGLN